MAGTRTTIVCIDDNLEMIGWLDLVLHGQGYVVIGTTSGHHGLEMIRCIKPDLVLLDLHMPDVSGEQVYSQIKAEDELVRIPIIVMTADDSSKTRYYWERVARSDGFIVKPFSVRELRQVVTNVMTDGRASALQ